MAAVIVRSYLSGFTALGAALLALGACGPAPEEVDTQQDALLVPPPAALDGLVGVAMAGSNNFVYAWRVNQVASAGNPANLVWERAPYRYLPATGKAAGSIVGMAIAPDDRIYTFYEDGTRSVGSSGDLDRYGAPLSYSLPRGKTYADIVGVAIAKSTSRVYTWYADGTRSVGNSRDLDYYEAPTTYVLPRGYTQSQIVGIAIGTDDRVHTWFDNGFTSIGTSTDLDAWRSPFRYTRHGLLQSQWPSNPPSQLYSPPPSPLAFQDIPNVGNDTLVAPGRRFVAVAGDASVRFYRRDGTPLSGSVFAYGNVLNLHAMFADFTRDANPSGSGALDVNHYLGFDQPCHNGYLTTAGTGFCVSGGPYDTRVGYDAIGDRFVIVAAMRNPVWTNEFGAEQGDWYSDEYIGCGAYTKPTGNANLGVTAWCRLARRLIAIAVSRTDDPREGFYTYVTTTSNYRDWPWMAIDGDWLITSHQGDEDLTGPVATKFFLPHLRNGTARPEYLMYRPSETGGAIVAEPPQQFGSLPNHSLLVAKDNAGKLRVIALPHPPTPYAKRAPQWTEVPQITDLVRERSVFRDGYLHLGTHPKQTTRGVTRYVKYHRIPISMAGDIPQVSLQSPAYRTTNIDPPASAGYLSHEEPLVEVNAAGDALITYGRCGVSSQPPHLGLPQKAYTVLWRANQALPDAPTLLADGLAAVGAETHGEEVKALGGGVDPVDDHRFWVIHKYGKSPTAWQTFMATIVP